MGIAAYLQRGWSLDLLIDTCTMEGLIHLCCDKTLLIITPVSNSNDSTLTTPGMIYTHICIYMYISLRKIVLPMIKVIPIMTINTAVTIAAIVTANATLSENQIARNVADVKKRFFTLIFSFFYI